MVRIIAVLLLSFAICSASSLPTEKLLSQISAEKHVISAVSRQTREQRVPLEDQLLGELAANGAILGNSVRGTPAGTPQIIILFNLQRTLSTAISKLRAKLYGPNPVPKPVRGILILDEDILFVKTFLIGLKIERALRGQFGLSAAATQALDTQRALAIEIIDARFGTFTV